MKYERAFQRGKKCEMGFCRGGAAGSEPGTTYRAGTPYVRFLNIYLGTRGTGRDLHALRPEASADFGENLGFW